jgi:two-component system, NtrC family, sensor kinase
MFRYVGMPHGFCFLWNPGLLRLHVASDSLIALSYFLIPIALLRIVRGRKDIPAAVYFCFTAFILACGVTHVMEVVTLWRPIYWASGYLKAATAVISLFTLGLLWRLVPTILAIPSRADLEKSDRRTASVLENSTVCAIAVDSKWKVHYINSNAMKLLKIEGHFQQGTTLWDLFPGQQASERDLILAVMETRQPASFEGYYLPLDLSSTAQVHPWDGGGIAVFFSDVSEQKRLQRELERERATRNQRIEVLAQFSAGLAHEIKNPLAIIHARASDLAEFAAEGNAPSIEMVAKACGSILKTADRALRILHGLVALARDGTHDPKQEAEIQGMVHLAMELVQRRYETHGITLEMIVPAGLPKVECRDVQIGQVLLNLLNNAFDAIDTSPLSERWVRIEASLEQAGEEVLIDIIDGGPALTEETREHLMEAFYTTKPLGEGIGIGLSVSRAIAEEHGGSLDLRDCKGHTCFRLTLPVHASQLRKVAA